MSYKLESRLNPMSNTATIPHTAPSAEALNCQFADIRPFPVVALKALNLASGTDTSLLELCNLIRTDLAFSTEVLRVANSPLVAFSKTITSVLQASMLLGFRRLKRIVITAGLKAYLAQSFSPLLHSCWRHSLATAIIAERLSKASSADKDAAYTGGIMHDIGRAAMVISMPRAYAQIVERGADQPHDLLAAERELCGMDHCQAGAALVKAWVLPEPFSSVTSCHHQTSFTAANWDPAGDGLANPALASPGLSDELSIVSLSCLLADSIGFGVLAYRKPRAYPEILVNLGEAAQAVLPTTGEELASEIADEIKLIESV